MSFLEDKFPEDEWDGYTEPLIYNLKKELEAFREAVHEAALEFNRATKQEVAFQVDFDFHNYRVLGEIGSTYRLKRTNITVEMESGL